MGKKILHNLVSEEKGSALILMVLLMVVIMGFASLVIDVGLMYLNSTQVANAADAAALAGAQALTVSNTQAEAIALQYAAKNRVSNVTVIISPDNKALEVKAQRDIGLYLARTLGFNTSTASASSKATLEPVTGVKGIVPLGVPEQEFIFGAKYVLKSAANDALAGEFRPGWLGLLGLQGPGAKLYLEDLKRGFDQEVSIGDVLNTQTGNISGDTYTGIQYRIDECKHIPSCTPESYHPDCPRIMLIPVISSNADKTVQVLGFAAFLVESVAGMGNESYINGYYIKYSVAGSSSITAPDNGIYVSRLTR